MMLHGYMDLQLFATEKREPATPRRRQLAREKGQVATSQEAGAAVSLLVGVFVMRFWWPFMSGLLAKKSVQVWSSGIPQDPTTGWALAVLKDVFFTVVLATLPLAIVVSMAGTVAWFLQVGLSFHPQFLAPDFKRVNPITGLARLISRRSLEGCLVSLCKFLVISYLTWVTLKKVWGETASFLIRDIRGSLAFLGETASKMALSVSFLLIIIGTLDYLYRWWEHEKSLMMSTQELKEELKETEGKPEVRNAIRARQRAIARRRMMQDVPSSDVVVANPTHYAVALKYEPEVQPAPVVLAKGLDEMALRIRRVAQENGVHVVEDPPLAQALYRAADVGEMIPEELYQAVAEVLAYVYRLSGKVPLEGAIH